MLKKKIIFYLSLLLAVLLIIVFYFVTLRVSTKISGLWFKFRDNSTAVDTQQNTEILDQSSSVFNDLVYKEPVLPVYDINSVNDLKVFFDSYILNKNYDKTVLKYDIYDEISEIEEVNLNDGYLKVNIIATKENNSSLIKERNIKFSCTLDTSISLFDNSDLISCYSKVDIGDKNKLLYCISSLRFISYKCKDFSCSEIENCIFY